MTQIESYLATFFVAALLSAVAGNFASLFIFRMRVGVGIGIDYPLSATFLAQFAPRTRRGSMMTWSLGLFFYAGSVAAMLVGFLLAHFGPDAWRILFASRAVPALALLILRRTLPDSPRGLPRPRKPDQAMAAVRRFHLDADLGELPADDGAHVGRESALRAAGASGLRGRTCRGPP